MSALKIVTATVLSVSLSASAVEEPGFYIIAKECKTLVGTLESRIWTPPASSKLNNPLTFACWRIDADKARCKSLFVAEEPEIFDVFTLGNSVFTMSSGGRQFFVVNTADGTAAYSMGFWNETMISSKICVGIYRPNKKPGN